MEDKQVDIIDLFKQIWKLRKKIAIYCLIGSFVGLVAAMSIPKEYVAKVKIVSENKNGNKSAMGGMSGLASMMGVNISAGAEVGITEDVYPEIMNSSPFLIEFATINVPYKGDSIALMEYLNMHEKKSWWKYVLAAPSQFIGWVFSSSDTSGEKPIYSVMNPDPKQRMFEGKLAGRISTKKSGKSSSYDLIAKMQDPIVAAIIADSLTYKLQRYMTKYYTSKSRKDLESSIELQNQARKNYYYTDSLFATATDKNQNLISKSAKLKIDRLETERDLAANIYQQLGTQVEMNRIKLQEDTPIATIIEPSRIPQGADSPNRLFIIISFAFLGGFVAFAQIIFRLIFLKTHNS